MSRDQTKSARYVQELDEARCNGNWDLVPELVRKIKKHAPARICLALTAEAEHAVALLRPTAARSSAARPPTAISNTTASDGSEISKYIPLLSDAIGKDRTHAEDDFQARVCLGWIHWRLGETKSAISRLPRHIEQELAQLDGTGKESAQWTRICALKAAYIKGTAEVRTGAASDAVEIFESALPILSSPSSSASKAGKEIRLWTELFLTGFCMAASKVIEAGRSNTLETATLSAFRAWAEFWESQGSSPAGGRASQSDVSRRTVWKEYYALLSDLLPQELPFPTTALTTTYAENSTKVQQRAELKRVENHYETLLLSEIQFPKAEQSSEEVEVFVGLVMHNWGMLCSSSWKEHDFSEGGAEEVSKGVLDILYRAATKTFHSTALLRHLFTVHLALAEFELAFKAFDTYMEIVKKGKARVEKTGEPEHGLDNDETVLRTASDCIKALCQYGRQEESDKAYDIGNYFEDWLQKHHPAQQANGNNNGRPLGNGNAGPVAQISPRIFSMAWRSIGIAYAQRARLTFDGSSRSDLQLKAIKCLRKALSPEYESTTDVETLFALGILLAERRELGPAVNVVKSGLLPRSSPSSPNELGPFAGRFARERALIPLWHLLALLMSARQEFITAARSCEGAFEQFQDPRNLFGAEELGGKFRSEHLNEKSAPHNLGVVDDMDDFEKENVLEVKMTQLSLIEVLEGPEIAVNASDELLSLYSRLFGDPQKELSRRPKPSTALAPPPKSSAGTIKSLKGSIFGRTSRSVRKSQMISLTEETPSADARPQTTHTVASTIAPKIQVTNENGNTSKHRGFKDAPHHHEKLQKKESLSRRKSGRSLRDRSVSSSRGNSTMRSPTVVDGETFFTPPTEGEHHWSNEGVRASQVGIAVSQDNSSQIDEARDSLESTSQKPLPPKAQQSNKKEVTPQATKGQDVRLSHVSGSTGTGPITRFPKDQQRRRRSTILVKVWLLISGFYRRASLHDDARGAIEEASKLVQGLEADVSKESSGGISVENAGMGGSRAVAQLWGDVYSERGYLAIAESSPYSALSNFESALTNCANHPSATVGLSNILLDIYTEDLLPPPSIPNLVLPGTLGTPSVSTLNTSSSSSTSTTLQLSATTPVAKRSSLTIRLGPLGIPAPRSSSSSSTQPQELALETSDSTSANKKAALLDRLAARDRAYGLLSNLTKLGTGWNYSEAWFALARAYELGGQEAKAREVLWWCVELEESRSVRGWEIAGSCGYVL